MHTRSGLWKEGRQGAASLFYIRIEQAQLSRVAKVHAQVGIRATLLLASLGDTERMLFDRNWELIPQHLESTDSKICASSTGWGECTINGNRFPEPHVKLETDRLLRQPIYRVEDRPGVIPGPEFEVGTVLPSQMLPVSFTAAQTAIEKVVSLQSWAIWLVDAAVLSELGEVEHAALLHWLGEHHARIWCAPIRDIVAWSSVGGHTV